MASSAPERKNLFGMFGAMFALLAIVLGAFGAHALKGVLSTGDLKIYHTAVDYQLAHAIALCLVAILAQLQGFLDQCFPPA